jgi:hypothetical protein
MFPIRVEGPPHTLYTSVLHPLQNSKITQSFNSFTKFLKRARGLFFSLLYFPFKLFSHPCNERYLILLLATEVPVTSVVDEEDVGVVFFYMVSVVS